MTKLMLCYGSPESVRTIEGDSVLIDEIQTAFFTASALDREAPHDCEPAVWLTWSIMRTFDGDEPLGIAGGSGDCPCEGLMRCPLGESDA